MLRLAAVLALCWHIFLGLGCSDVARNEKADSPNLSSKAAVQSLPGIKAPSVMDVPPEDMRRALTAAYRLRPDKRFLLAIGEVERLVSGGETEVESASAEFFDGSWRISYKGQEVGLVPELPDFPDLMSVLDKWAKSLQQKTPLKLTADDTDPTQGEIRAHLDRFFAPDLAASLRLVDTLWREGSRHPALLHVATRALVLMNLQLLDSLETADLLPARALATLAVTKAATDLPCGHEESLLAYTMGYSVHAAALGKELPESDPVRLYVTHDDLHLMAYPAGNDELTVEARYFYLLRLADQRGDMAAFITWVKSSFPDEWVALPVFKAGLELKKFSSDPVLSEALPRLVLLDLAREVDIMPEMTQLLEKVAHSSFSRNELAALIRNLRTVLTTETSTMVNRFDSSLRMLEPKYTGPFLDARVFQAYYRGYFFSALYALGSHYLSFLSSLEAEDRFAPILGHPDNGIAADFQRWYRHLFASKEGAENLDELANDLTELPALGAPPLMRTLGEQEKYFTSDEVGMLSPVKELVSRMDSRVSHRRYLGFIAQTHLLDLKLMEKMFSSAQTVDAPNDQSLQAWYAYYAGNTDLLLKLLRTPGVRPEVKAKTLEYLSELEGASPDVLESEYRWLIQDNPDNYELHSRFVNYLDRAKKYSEGRSVMSEWLKRRGRESAGTEQILARTTIALMFYREVLYQEGWKEIKPVAKSRQEGVMALAARLLDALGRMDDAEKMAQTIVSMYPGRSEGRALLAWIYWRHGRYVEAADVLKDVPRKIGPEAWQSVIAAEFADAFKNAPEEKIKYAFSSLLARDFDPLDLAALPALFARNGQNETAFAMSSQLHSIGANNMELLIGSYRYLKAWKDKEVALEWLRKQIPPQNLNSSDLMFLREEEPDLLWDLITDPGKGERPDFVWLMRAVASARMGMAKDPHRGELIDYYGRTGEIPSGFLSRLLRKASREDSRYRYHHTIGRFLVGMISEKEMQALAMDPKKRCEVAYYLGLRAQGEGRYEDASDWLRVAVETGSVQSAEYRWAYDTLYAWRSKGRSLARIGESVNR